MPPAIPVRLVAHDPTWPLRAEIEGARIRDALGLVIVGLHHFGSTSIPNIVAKPVLDLLGVAASLAALEEAKEAVEALGYEWHGEFGLAGRCYCTLSDPNSGERRVHLHCYAAGDPALRRHLAFRDHLCAHAHLAKAYELEKSRCAALHPDDSHAYCDCKDLWIRKIEAEALALSQSAF